MSQDRAGFSGCSWEEAKELAVSPIEETTKAKMWTIEGKQTKSAKEGASREPGREHPWRIIYIYFKFQSEVVKLELEWEKLQLEQEREKLQTEQEQEKLHLYI